MRLLPQGLVLALAIVCLVPFAAEAGCTAQTVGSVTYTNCTDGTSFTILRLGSVDYYSGDVSGHSQQLGTTYHNFDGRTGTTQKLGDFGYHSFGGQYGTSQQLGSFGYHDFGGRNGTTQSLGGFTYGSGSLFGD